MRFRLHDQLLGFGSNLVVEEKLKNEEPQTFASGNLFTILHLAYLNITIVLSVSVTQTILFINIDYILQLD